MLEAVCSGGQIGADIAGLRAAKSCGLKTFGWMPKGFKTKKGPKPEWAKEFNLQEHTSPAYPQRTRLNVRSSDATLRLAIDFSTMGELCTLRELRAADKPHMDIPLQSWLRPSPQLVAGWITKNNFKTINIAGNGIEILEPKMEEFLTKVFTIVVRKQMKKLEKLNKL